MELGPIIFEALTLALIIFGALAIFMLRRRAARPHETYPPAFWFRFTGFFFVSAVIVFIEGILLRPFGFFWLVMIGGITLFAAARFGHRILTAAGR